MSSRTVKLSVQNTLPNSHQGISYNRDTCTKNENYYSLFCLSPDKEFLVGMTCFILKKISVTLCLVAALKFQRFLPWQIKCRGNYMKLHFASALPLQCFCRGWQDFILRASAFTWATSAKTSTRSKLVRLLALLHISPRIRSIMCTIQFKILKDHQYTFKVRRHPLFVAAQVIIITIRFTHMKNNRFTSQSSLLSIWPYVGLCFFKQRGCFNSIH